MQTTVDETSGKTTYETDVRDYNYKCLGLPITDADMDPSSCCEKLVKSLYMTLIQVIAHAETKQLNICNRLTLYKTVIRTHMNHGVRVMSTQMTKWTN